MVEPTDTKTPRPWALWLLLPLMAVGIFAGVYMSWHHEIQLYGGAELQGELMGCVESEKVSCDIVNTSDWSELFGVPQFTWAIPMYVLIGLLALWGTKERRVIPLIFALGLFNAAYSVLLGYISYYELGKLCTWCIRLYGINFATPVLALVAGMSTKSLPDGRVLGGSAGIYIFAAIMAIGGQRAYRSQLLADAPELETEIPAVAAEPENAGPELDPTGDAPILSWSLKTEDGNEATLTLEPDDAWKGNPEATVAVVEYADLECGYCKRASGQLKRLYEAYGDRVLFVFKHYPMDPACNPGVKNKKHRYACLAAEGAVCAKQQGRFWSFHDLAFKNQHQLKPEDLTRYAEAAGTDVPKWTQCMRERGGKPEVVADGTSGKALDIHGTPRIWINGKLYRAGSSAEQMARAIELALGTAAADASQNAAALREQRAPIKAIPADVQEMQKISYDGLTFEIDTFEAGLADGKATSGKHQIPAIQMGWFAARDACEAAGKRLCSEEEWITACQGSRAIDDDQDGEFADDMVEGTTYPYEDFHDPRRCWDGKDRNTMRPVYTGEMPGCMSKDGVYDLTGNVEEWVGTSPETAVLLGGAFDTSKDHARCYRRNDTFGAGYANQRTGFRCCR